MANSLTSPPSWWTVSPSILHVFEENDRSGWHQLRDMAMASSADDSQRELSIDGGSAGRWDVVCAERQAVIRMLLSRHVRLEDAQDCTQEAMLRVAVHPTLNKSTAGALLRTVALRLAIDIHRQDQRRALMMPATAAIMPCAVSSHENIVCDADEARWLQPHVQSLPTRQRDVFRARVSGLSPTAAAAALGITVKAADCAYTRARAQLRLILEASSLAPNNPDEVVSAGTKRPSSDA